MGLDMYLVRIKKGQEFDYDDEEDLVYWRKANQIHRWFVENVQNGEDKCKPYQVSKEKIEELKNLCEEVLKKSKLVKGKVVNNQTLKNGEWINEYRDGEIISNPEIAEELLPTYPGFFFGNTDYDEHYLADVRYTKEEFEKILNTLNFDEYDVYYYSSW